MRSYERLWPKGDFSLHPALFRLPTYHCNLGKLPTSLVQEDFEGFQRTFPTEEKRRGCSHSRTTPRQPTAIPLRTSPPSPGTAVPPAHTFVPAATRSMKPPPSSPLIPYPPVR